MRYDCACGYAPTGANRRVLLAAETVRSQQKRPMGARAVVLERAAPDERIASRSRGRVPSREVRAVGNEGAGFDRAAMGPV